MTPKERAAMQQALGALVRAEAMYGQPNADIQAALRESLEHPVIQEPVGHVLSDGTICWDRWCPDAGTLLYTAPQPDMNLNCKSVQKRLATVWGYVKAEQAEQEPVAWCWMLGECAHIVWGSRRPDDAIHTTPLYTSPQPVSQEPVEQINYEEWEFNPMTGESLWGKQPVSQEPVAWMNKINGFICKEKTRSYHVPLYTAPQPVKEGELTDDEIKAAYESWWESNGNHAFPIWVGAKAVIAKYKEKNK